jgi:hypothetical protein
MTVKIQLTLLLALLSHLLYAQVPILCNSPANNGSETCENACLLCNFLSLTDNSDAAMDSSSPFCGTVTNDKWYAFVAGATGRATFILSPSNCVLGDGLQMAVYEDCQSAPIECSFGTQGGGNTSLTMDFPVRAGQIYYLMVDGFAGDICEFNLTAAPTNIFRAGQVSAVGNINGPSRACPGGIFTYSVDPVLNASHYTWTIPASAYINGLPGPGPHTFEKGVGERVEIEFTTALNSVSTNVSVQATNGCFSSAVRAKTVTVAPLPPIHYSIRVCANRFPYILPWGDVVNTPGVYTETLTSFVGCDSVVRITVIQLPPITRNLGKITLCSGETFRVCGNTFSTPGSYSGVTCPTLGGQECDTIYSFTIERTSAVITGGGSLNCFNNTVTLRAGSSPGQKNWKNAAGQLLGSADSLIVTAPGKYTLEVTNTVNGVPCIATKEIEILAVDSLTINPIINAIPKMTCRTAPVSIFFASNMPAIVSGLGNTTKTSTAHLIRFPVATAGPFALTATTAGGCMATYNGIIEVDTIKPVFTATGDSITCTKSAMLRAVATTANTSFIWKRIGTNATTSGANIQVAQPGLYEVTAISTNSCSSTRVVEAVDNGAPQFAILPEFLSCGNPTPTIRLTAQNNIPNVIYKWTGPNGFTSSVREPQVPAAGAYNLTVTNRNNGCSTVYITYVQVNTQFFTLPPTIQGDTLGCLRTTVQMPNLFSPTLSGTLVYRWTGPAGFTSTQANPTVSVPGNYNVTVSNSTGSCTASSVVVIVQSSILPTAQATGGTLPCKTPALTVRVTTNAANAAFQWSGPGGFSSTLQNPSVNQFGSYRVTVTNVSNGCTAVASAIVNQNAGAPFVSLSIMTMTNGTRRINCTTTAYNPVFAWTGPAGFTSTLRNPTIGQPGTYTVLVTDGLSGCQAYRSIVVPVLRPTSLEDNPANAEEIGFATGFWKVFPNPAENVVNLSFEGNKEPAATRIHLIDAVGRLVKEQTVNGESTIQINISDLPAGAYRVVFIGENGVETLPLVVGKL